MEFPTDFECDSRRVACVSSPARAGRGSQLARLSPDLGTFFIRLLAVTAMLLLLVLCFEPRFAFSQGTQLVKVDVTVVAKGYRASKLFGSSVTNDKNENIGKIDDIIIDHKNVLFAVLQVGGFLGVGGRLVAVPYDSLVLDETGKKIELPGATKDQLKSLSEFKYTT